MAQALRKDEVRNTRRAILDEALDLFSVHGYAGTSIRQIARAVEVRESALYHHFPSKAAIFEALLHEYGPGKTERLSQLDLDAALAGGVQACLRTMAVELFEEWALPREQKFARLMMSEAPRLSTAGIVHPAAILGQSHTHMVHFLEELVRRQLIRPGDLDLYALEFMGPLIMLRQMYLMMSWGLTDMRVLKNQVEQHVHHFCQSVKL
ncbi:TetR/AcrR family transcriptional regulator [Stigmatella erecta]|uniref:Transcriptional regulator, TetR family n=1 Tax=Stigmatella erecta TaxID=83460 RepID=A0A1I0KLV2_9BACT|nr:TetR/AcrR family transcriptional regulator [Stigmatella erecta]SEU26022.1 transcriptional regulator, TetR family [Stigmatella erecta]